MNDLEKLFLLDPEVIFLNHGSFGACPRPVFEVYQSWQRRLESQPVRFFSRELDGYFEEARLALGNYLDVAADDLVYVPNATYGVNVVARSLSLGPGDEVLATDHEYGSCDRAWRFLSRKLRQHRSEEEQEEPVHHLPSPGSWGRAESPPMLPRPMNAMWRK